MLVVDYIFSGESGDLLEVVFMLHSHPNKFNIPIERIAILEQKLKQNWKITFTELPDSRLKYICDGTIYFFPKVLYIDHDSHTKVEGLEVFAPKE